MQAAPMEAGCSVPIYYLFWACCTSGGSWSKLYSQAHGREGFSRQRVIKYRHGCQWSELYSLAHEREGFNRERVIK